MAMQKRRKSTHRMDVHRLIDIPNVGVSIAGDLQQLGIETPSDLVGRDPYQLHAKLCQITGKRHDPCVIDVFISAVRYMEGGPSTPWWKFTEERKRTLSANEPPLRKKKSK